jgi:ABC-type polysaccharide/polyol phosphate transport system ATPase subunit
MVTVEGVYKRYTTVEYRPSLRHEAVALAARLAGRTREKAVTEPFYALRDVSFTVAAGETLAIIGRNGSGKTTMLRLLAGITRPTAGRIHIGGAFASLIALGAGFNPEMSGRDNILLNAAIQGVHPRVTRGLMDAIIAYADIGAFIDVPVKRYSSGMNARLGFSIALHIMPRILFVDEVLAVGDAAFRAKCNVSIRGFVADGGTLVLVTHEASQARELCTRTLWLNRGVMEQIGPTAEVLHAYEQHGG